MAPPEISDLIASGSPGRQRSAARGRTLNCPRALYLPLPPQRLRETVATSATAEGEPHENLPGPFTAGAKGACKRGALLPRVPIA